MFFRYFLLLLFLVLVMPANSFSHGAVTSDDSAVAEELRTLSASVDRLASVLESNTGKGEQDLLFKKLNLAIAYLNFRSRRIESLEQDVQFARNSRAQIESTLNVWLKQQEEMASADSTLPSEESRQRSEDFKMRIEMVKGRIARLDNEIVVLENRVFELQDQIDSVEEFVQKNLNL